MKRIFTALFFATSVIATAQWNSNITENLPVTSLRSSTSMTAGTSDGKTYVFFYEIGEASTLIPRVQLLDKNGHKMFGDQGLVVNTITPYVTSSQVMDMVVDNDNNLYLTFVASNNQIYLQKITSVGQLPWGSSGVVAAASGGLYPKILPLADSVLLTYDSYSRIAQISKFNKETGAALWATPKTIASVDGMTRTTLMEFSQLSDGSYIAIMQGRLNNYATTGKLYAQRYDANGDAVWAAPIAVHSTTGVSRMARLAHFVDASDNVYFSYTSNLSAATLKYDAYVQKITANGELPWVQMELI